MPSIHPLFTPQLRMYVLVAVVSMAKCVLTHALCQSVVSATHVVFWGYTGRSTCEHVCQVLRHSQDKRTTRTNPTNQCYQRTVYILLVS